MTFSRLVEIRDSATYIPALMIVVRSGRGQCSQWEAHLLGTAGYWQSEGLFLMRLSDGVCFGNYLDWSEQGGRTMGAAHRYLRGLLDDGILDTADPKPQMVDVEFILGETQREKRPEFREDV